MAAAPLDALSREGSEARPGIAVIVVNWRREQATVDCCRRLLAWSQLKPQVVVVDNGSKTESVERLKQSLGGVTVLAAGSNRGFGGANNLAVAGITSDFILLLNNDADLEEETAALLLDFMRSHPKAGIAGPVLEAASAPHEVLAAGGRDILRFGRTHSTAAERAAEIESQQPFSADYVPGTAALVRTSLLRDLGGFDEAYFFSGEMADLSTRARRLGAESFVVPAARARHDLAVASGLRDSLYPYYSLRNRFLYARRHARWPKWSAARWIARGALSCLASLARGQVGQARHLALAIADGVAGRFGEASTRIRL